MRDLEIGEAVQALRDGKRIARAGWNGKDMYLFLVDDEGATTEFFLDNGRHEFEILPHVMMKTVQGTVIPWLCSQSDLLAWDWYVLEA